SVDVVFFFQAEDGIRDRNVTGVQTCALPIFVILKIKYFLLLLINKNFQVSLNSLEKIIITKHFEILKICHYLRLKIYQRLKRWYYSKNILLFFILLIFRNLVYCYRKRNNFK